MSDRLTEDELNAMQARFTTPPAHWEVEPIEITERIGDMYDPDGYETYTIGYRVVSNGETVCKVSEEDEGAAEFIASQYNNTPRLIAEVRRLRAELAGYEQSFALSLGDELAQQAQARKELLERAELVLTRFSVKSAVTQTEQELAESLREIIAEIERRDREDQEAIGGK